MVIERTLGCGQHGFCWPFAHAVLNHVSTQGGDPSPVLVALGQPALSLQANDGPRVTALQLSAALNAAALSLHDEHIGLSVGLGLGMGLGRQPVHMGALGYAAMTAPNGIRAMVLYEALQRLLMTEMTMRHEIKGQLVCAHLDGASRLPHDYAFWSFALACRLSFIRRVCAKRIVPERVALPCPPPSCQQALHLFVGSAVQFNANAYSEWLPYAPLLAPNPHSSPEIHSVMATMARRQWHDAFDLDKVLISDLKGGILRALAQGANPTLRSLAPVLAIGERQLQRKLAVHQCSFRSLLEDVRRERALGQLRLTDRPLADIAAEAGYAELSSFHRAVRRWTGVTPMRIRNAGEERDIDLV